MALSRTPRNKVTPPLKGSFPLDHDGECKDRMRDYMECLKKTSQNSRACREESRQYLACRMEKDLMTKEPLDTLGFKDLKPLPSENQPQNKS
ncbi:uncharacterized protein LOC135820876 [Sycon ciliatum]|uniref:uncharacterized protein LOC135820876 n=1 Tax=Sycon ciliatum TaxID=27933 RepID=UPI0020AC4F43